MANEDEEMDQAESEPGSSALGSGAEGTRAGFLARLRRDMTRNEQLVVYLGAALALGAGLFVAVSPSTVTHGSKSTHVSSVLVAIIGAASFVVMAAVARYGRRTVAAIITLLVSFVTVQPLGYGYIALGAWLFYRGTRAQRERMAAQRGTTGGSPSRGARNSGTAGRSAGRGRGRQPEPPKRPASKRYTPPGTKGRPR